MTEYEFTKRDNTLFGDSFRIIFETNDLAFLEYMDKEIDKLIEEFYEEEI